MIAVFWSQVEFVFSLYVYTMHNPSCIQNMCRSRVDRVRLLVVNANQNTTASTKIGAMASRCNARKWRRWTRGMVRIGVQTATITGMEKRQTSTKEMRRATDRMEASAPTVSRHSPDTRTRRQCCQSTTRTSPRNGRQHIFSILFIVPVLLDSSGSLDIDLIIREMSPVHFES